MVGGVLRHLDRFRSNDRVEDRVLRPRKVEHRADVLLAMLPEISDDAFGDRIRGDPFSPALLVERARPASVLLPNGLALIAGGVDLFGNTLASAELFDALTLSFSFAGSLDVPIAEEVLLLLPTNGKVLCIGGRSGTTATAASRLFQ